jgi:hypothetical protein
MIILRLILTSAAGLALAGPGGASGPPPFSGAATVADAVLATQRGGVRLPNGIDLALSVQSQTSVNGAVVLQTVFAVNQGPATLTVYAPPKGTIVPAAPGSPRPAATASMTPTVSYTPRTGLTVTQGFGALPVTVGNAQPGSGSVAAGLAALDQGAPQETAGGSVASRTDGLLRTVTLSGSDFSVTHLAGAAFGTAIANSGSDRAIDTVTTISIDLGNAGPDMLGSVFFRVENVALGALGSRM